MKNSIDQMDCIWVVEYGTNRKFYTVEAHALKKYKSYKYAKYMSVKMFQVWIDHTELVSKNNPEPPPPKQPPIHIAAHKFSDLVDFMKNNPPDSYVDDCPTTFHTTFKEQYDEDNSNGGSW